jgi:tetratricopeptide (TPR) repeat protein
MERHSAAIQRVLGDKEFDTPDEMNEFLNANLDSIETDAPPPQSALARAQEIVYDAWESPSPRRRRSLAQKALEACADCADAHVILAEDAAGPAKALPFYQQAVEAGERALGAEWFNDYVGEFWGYHETRPYMRARLGLAQCLWATGRKTEAVGHYEDMLRLNPNDNQGVRHVLAACLLDLNDGDRINRLFARYDEEFSAEWQYVRALWAYRQEGDSDEARRQAKEALECNHHVPDYFTGQRMLPARLPASYQLGGEDEAVLCAAQLGHQWDATPGAVEWLETVKGEAKQPSKRKRASSRSKKKSPKSK